MAKFMVIHPFPGPMAIADAKPVGKAVKAHNTVDAYWVKTWAMMDDGGKITKIFCQWNAKDVESIQKVLDNIPNLPTEGISPMQIFDAEDFR